MAEIETLLTPMWQRIEAGEVDLSAFSDEEILSGKLTMADGRLLPTPARYPDTFIAEQVRRGFRKAQANIRKNALKALEVYEEVMIYGAEDKDRLKAGQFFLDRFLGKESNRLTITHEGSDPREELVNRLLAARRGLPANMVQQVVDGDADEAVDADMVMTLEDLL